MIFIMASDYENLKCELEQITEITEENIFGTTIYKGIIGHNRVVFVNSGITKVDFTRNFVNIISKYNICKVIGIGNAASLCECLKVGDIGICKNSLQYDVDFTSLGYKLAEIPELNKIIFNSNVQLIELAKQACEKEKLIYGIGKTISADKFVSDSEEADRLKNIFNGDILDTECGVLGELSYLYCIPAITIKGVSNYANDWAVNDYEKYRNIANQRSLKVALNMLKLKEI